MDVQEFLKQKGVEFELVPHAQTFTAQEVAAAEHETGHHFAKTVVATGGAETFMFVLPASRHVDFEKAAKLVGKKVEMASEGEMKKVFPDCEVGAEPPFGSQIRRADLRGQGAGEVRADRLPRGHARPDGEDELQGLQEAGEAKGGQLRHHGGLKRTARS